MTPTATRLHIRHAAQDRPSPAALLDIDAAAERLGTPTRFIRRLVADRRIRHYKVGRYIRFDPADLDAWLTDNRRDAVSRGAAARGGR